MSIRSVAHGTKRTNSRLFISHLNRDIMLIDDICDPVKIIEGIQTKYSWLITCASEMGKW